MLKKLIRYDMKYLSHILVRVFIIGLFAVFAVSALFCYLVSGRGGEPVLATDIAAVLGSTLFMPAMEFAAFAVVIVVQAIFMVRIYKNMFSSEGYLTFTLPVKTDDILRGKVFSGTVWTAFSSLFMLVTWALLFVSMIHIYGMSGEEFFRSVFKFGTDELPQTIVVILKFAACYAVAASVISAFYNSTVSLLAFSIGQLAKKSRIIAGIGAYFVITGAVSSLNAVITLLVFLPVIVNAGNITLERLSITCIVAAVVLLLTVTAATIASYVFAKRILDKKLNPV